MTSLHRCAFVLLAACLLAPPLAQAAVEPPPVNPVVRDCLDNGRLDRHFRNADLARAGATLAPDIAEYTACPALVRSQRAVYLGHKGKPGVAAVTTDCVAHTGLRARYPTAQLRRALATLPADIDEYTPCRGAIWSQLSALERPVSR